MTLEDFFTLTELKDGLTTPTRVNELLTVMQKEKECVVKNINEATRQWSAVASTIATTENKECLDLFIQLDGLWFIDKWLNDAQKFRDDSENSFWEELIVSLLQALDKLQVDNEASMASGIGRTVNDLCDHGSSVIRDKAKALCDRWTPVQEIDANPMGDDATECIFPCRKGNDEKVEQLGDQKMVSVCTDVQETKEETNIESLTTNTRDPVDSSSLSVIGSGNSPVNVESDGLKSVSTREEQFDGSQLNKETESSDKVESNTIKTEMKEDTIDKDEDMVDGVESSKTTSNSKSHDDDDGSEKSSHFSKRSSKSQDNNLISKRPSDMELDYGMVDPLELARQVAIEVEQEVDSREQSCSTSQNEVAEPVNEIETFVSKIETCQPDIKTTQVSEEVQESDPNAKKGVLGFDLNDEVSSEELDPVSTPISIVSASRAIAADGLPVAPLQFEGTLGWKGSAATSAFRRVPEVEKTFSPSRNHRQRLDCLDIDLNVCEDRIEEPERLQLDLNNTFGDNDSGAIGFDWKRDSRVASLKQNGPQSPSISSSSSSMQPSFRNIDLNSNHHSDNPFLGKLFNKRDESVISIFGTQFEVNRNLDPAMDFNLGPYPYANLPGFAMGPAMYGPPGGNGPIPYMVPQFMAAPAPAPAPPPLSQPFMFNMAATGAPSGSNGAGPSRYHNFDLNSEGGTRESNGGLRQFFNHGQGSSSSSVIGGKRQEPDSGWEAFPINYKHHQQPPWQ